MTRYLFLGGIFPKEFENEVKENSRGNIQYAANKVQLNLINGLDCNLKEGIEILNVPFVSDYPLGYKKAKIREFEFSHNNTNEDKSVGFVNISLIKHIHKEIVLKKHLKKWINKYKYEKKEILIYSVHAPFLKAVNYIKRIDKSIKVTLIVPDLPQYMNISNKRSFLYKILKKVDIKIIMSNITCIDKFVLFTEKMNEFINPYKKPYVVVEGICTIQDINIKNKNKKHDINIVYAGGLDKKYGVINLVDAFNMINDEKYKLILCGNGEAKEYIMKKQKDNNRINFKGILNKTQLEEVYKNADIFVNPRQNSGCFTKFSFPSKNLEYLSYKRPVIAYKLDGIPKEYNDLIFYVKNNEIKSLAEKIIEVANMTEYDKYNHCNNAYDYITKYKSSKEQVRKILSI